MESFIMSDKTSYRPFTKNVLSLRYCRATIMALQTPVLRFSGATDTLDPIAFNRLTGIGEYCYRIKPFTREWMTITDTSHTPRMRIHYAWIIPRASLIYDVSENGRGCASVGCLEFPPGLWRSMAVFYSIPVDFEVKIEFSLLLEMESAERFHMLADYVVSSVASTPGIFSAKFNFQLRTKGAYFWDWCTFITVSCSGPCVEASNWGKSL
ncbi:hypothetical protein DFH27DRAFT_104095 [Peziza echinospora]|nr:hypothetical protein DFH27DRAFT_104095 [Peziza echinospora]